MKPQAESARKWFDWNMRKVKEAKLAGVDAHSFIESAKLHAEDYNKNKPIYKLKLKVAK